MSKKNKNLIDSIAPNLIQVVVLILSVAAAYYIGRLSAQVNFYEKNASLGANQGAVNPGAAPEDQLPQPTNVDNLELLTDGDHVRGDANAKIAVIEYSDYDCPFCASFHETAKQVIDESNGEVMWIYRHFPLDGLHPEARQKAIAAECAAALGGNDAFWSFSDELFSSETPYSQINSVAEKVGLDTDKFQTCLSQEAPRLAVEYDEKTANEVGVQGTPGNYIVNLETKDVVPLRGAEPIQNVRDAIDSIK